MAQTPPYASMKQSRETLKLGSREMLNPAWHQAFAVQLLSIRSTLCWRPLLTHPYILIVGVYAEGPSTAWL